MKARQSVNWVGLVLIGVVSLAYLFVRVDDIRRAWSPKRDIGFYELFSYQPGQSGKGLGSPDKTERRAAMIAIRAAGAAVRDDDLQLLMSYGANALTDAFLADPTAERGHYAMAVGIVVDCASRSEPRLVAMIDERACAGTVPDLSRCLFAASTLSRIDPEYGQAFAWAPDGRTLESVECEVLKTVVARRGQGGR